MHLARHKPSVKKREQNEGNMYFSERVVGPRPRNVETIDDKVWLAIRALILSRIRNGAFGAGYPDTCPDGPVVVGCDEDAMKAAMSAEVPDVPDRAWWSEEEMRRPTTLQVLDMIQFCWRAVGKPKTLDYHRFFMHHHLTFDVDAGRREFCESVNRVFRRSGLAFVLTEDGIVERTVPEELTGVAHVRRFETGDQELDAFLETAVRKFLNPKDAVRREALESLWDAWERLKTTGQGTDKKAQATDLLVRTAGSSSSKFYERLQKEAKALTDIGNELRIRHSERTQERLSESEHVDYLFYRLMSLIRLILRRTRADNP